MNLAVAFVKLYDALEGARRVVHLRDILEARTHESLARWVSEQAAKGTLALPAGFSDLEAALGYAVGLHDALRRADPLFDANPPPALTGYRNQLAAKHNLLPDLNNGALITSHVQSRRPSAGPTQLADFFPSLRRIDATTFGRLGWVRLPRHRDLLVDKDLKVASVPFLAERADVAFTSCRKGSYYAARPTAAQLVDYVPAALAALDASGAQLAVLPEAALDEELLNAWRDACRTTETSGDLRLLLVGTGPVTVQPDGCLLAGEFPDPELGVLPHNRAVLLERATGEVLWAQDKQRGFSMNALYRKRVGLLIDESDVKDINGTLDELMTDSPGLNLLDSRCCRIATLICEDLGRLTDTGALIFRAGVGLALAPILAPPILPNRWQEGAAKYLTPDGTDVVVVNSLALGREDLDPQRNYSPRSGVPAASLVAITDADEPMRRPKEHEGMPSTPREDALRVRVVVV